MDVHIIRKQAMPCISLQFVESSSSIVRMLNPSHLCASHAQRRGQLVAIGWSQIFLENEPSFEFIDLLIAERRA